MHKGQQDGPEGGKFNYDNLEKMYQEQQKRMKNDSRLDEQMEMEKMIREKIKNMKPTGPDIIGDLDMADLKMGMDARSSNSEEQSNDTTSETTESGSGEQSNDTTSEAAESEPDTKQSQVFF